MRRTRLAAASLAAALLAFEPPPALPQAADGKKPKTAVLTPQGPLALRGKKEHSVQALKIVVSEGKPQAGILVENCENLTIQYCEVGPGDMVGISVSNSRNVRIVNSWVHDTGTRLSIHLYKCTDVLIQGNRLERGASGVYALESTGVKVIGNYVEDVQGPFPRGQLAQFDKVTGEGNCISQNYAINFAGKSTPEDMINIYKSEGTEKSPILIEKNFLCGDPEKGSADKSKSGSGIMMGDGGGKPLRRAENTLFAPGQVGIGVCGGSNIAVEKNQIYGLASNQANVGMYVWNQSKAAGADIVVRDNTVAWKNAKGDNSSFWKGGDNGGFERVTIENNRWDAWAFFKASPLRPPSARPYPPKPFGEPIFPWKEEPKKP